MGKTRALRLGRYAASLEDDFLASEPVALVALLVVSLVEEPADEVSFEDPADDDSVVVDDDSVVDDDLLVEFPAAEVRLSFL